MCPVNHDTAKSNLCLNDGPHNVFPIKYDQRWRAMSRWNSFMPVLSFRFGGNVLLGIVSVGLKNDTKVKTLIKMSRRTYFVVCFERLLISIWEGRDVSFRHHQWSSFNSNIRFYRTGYCETGWKSFKANYYCLGVEKMNFSRAQEQCQELGAELASIHDKEEQGFIERKLTYLVW